MVFKGCARCSGDLYIEEEVGSRDLVCLQCGSRVPLVSTPNAEDSEDEGNMLRWLQAHPTTIAA